MKKPLLLLFVLILIQSTLYAQSSVKVESKGSGKPIIFLPGFATPGEVWNVTVQNLPNFQSHVVTYAGFGGVSPVEMPWYGKLKSDLIAYIEDQNLENITLVGHSMGGNLALDLAAYFSDKIQKVVIVDALACMREVMMPGVPAEALAYQSPYNDQLLAMDEAARGAYLDQMTQNMMTRPEDQAQVKSWMSMADRKTFVYGYVDLLKLDSRPLLPSIQAPVLIMVAGQPFGPGAMETMKNQYSTLPHATFAFAAESRHYLMLDQPEWFNQQLSSFISQ